MRKTSNLFVGGLMVMGLTLIGGLLWNRGLYVQGRGSQITSHETTKFGAFLASQHAVYVNDFEAAAKFADVLRNEDSMIVKNTIALTEFLGGKMPAAADEFKEAGSAPLRFIYDAQLIAKNDWDALYARHRNDESVLSAPLRIWSAIGVDRYTETLKFVDSMPSANAWKAFVRGQIYAHWNKIEQAAAEFAKVPADFMNINDYLYVTAFYNHNGMTDAADALRAAFTAGPGGMYMLDVQIAPRWADYAGLQQNMAFSMIQNVSHTSVMMYSDLSLLMLRFAEIVQGGRTDPLNYYLGLYFFNNGGDYMRHFMAIPPTSPFYAFAMMKIAEKSGEIGDLENVVRANPLFVPAIDKLVAKNIQTANRAGALRVVDDALRNKNLTPFGRAFLYKTRAHIYLTFGDFISAQTDVRAAADILTIDPQILSLQARIWAAENRELETAYEYAMALVTNNPTNIESWDTLGVVIRAREGAAASLEVIERVGEVSLTCSSLFEHLGDLYTEIGNTKNAVDAYQRAIALSDDGLVVVKFIEKKLKRLNPLR